MTIISAVYVPDGIAMAADSRLTYQIQRDNNLEIFPITDNSQKLVLLRDETIGISFCGNAIIEGRTISDFLRLFDIKYVSTSDTVEDIAYKLNEVLSSYYKEYEVNFIIAGFDNDVPFIFEISKSTVKRWNVNDDRSLYNGCVWLGETEAVTKLFLGENITKFNFDLMPLKDAVDLSEFIVELTIKYQRFQDALATCGGDIDLLVITKDYTKFLQHKIL